MKQRAKPNETATDRNIDILIASYRRERKLSRQEFLTSGKIASFSKRWLTQR